MIVPPALPPTHPHPPLPTLTLIPDVGSTHQQHLSPDPACTDQSQQVDGMRPLEPLSTKYSPRYSPRPKIRCQGGWGEPLVYGIRTRRAQEKGREERNAGDRRFWRAVAAIPRKRGREVNHKGGRERERESEGRDRRGSGRRSQCVTDCRSGCSVVRLVGWLYLAVSSLSSSSQVPRLVLASGARSGQLVTITSCTITQHLVERCSGLIGNDPTRDGEAGRNEMPRLRRRFSFPATTTNGFSALSLTITAHSLGFFVCFCTRLYI